METCVLIDGHSEAYRAYFAMSRANLAVRETGEQTGAVFGFLRQLIAVIREHNPDAVVVAFDPKKTFRDDLFPAYKATRERMPDDLRGQIGRIHQVLDAMNIRTLTVDNYEADDVIGTLAARAEAAGMQVLIKTGDRDLFQLATDRVRVIYTSSRSRGRNDIYDSAAVEQRFGVRSEQFVHMKALQGDSSDNIPGVPGVGEKSAVKLVRQFGSVQGLYAGLEGITAKKLKRNLAEHREQVERNLELVRIVRDVPVEFDLEDADPLQPDHVRLSELMKELGLQSTLNQYNELLVGQGGLFDDGLSPVMATAEQERLDRAAGYVSVTTEAQLQELAASLQACANMAFDFETTSVDGLTADVVGLALSWDVGKAAYIPIAHETGSQLPWELVRNTLAAVFADGKVAKTAHNAKYDLLVARGNGLEIVGELHDTMLMAYAVDAGQHRLGLKDLALRELDVVMQPITDLIGTGRNQQSFASVEPEQAAVYAADDAAQTLALHHRLKSALKAGGLWQLYADIEFPLVRILADMEARGVRLDRDYLLKLQAEYRERLEALVTRMYELAGREFNVRSTQQLSQVLFDKGGFDLPTKGLRKTKSGNYSTAAGVLEDLEVRLRGEDTLTERQAAGLGTILEYRQLHKLSSTYVDNLLAMMDAETDRVHTSFNQAGAATGRMSSNNPNLQNIPIRTEEGRRLRRAFIAEPGHVMLAADYSQVELRVLAHVAGDERLTRAFQEEQDIHAITAAELFRVPLTDVDRSQRALGKTINFATIYGSTAFGLSQRTEMSVAEAEEFLTRYFETYPRVEQWVEDTRQAAARDGHVTTLTGRKRLFPELQGGKLPPQQRRAVERAAINAPIQGSAADILKIAMAHVERVLERCGLSGRMLLQVHDELVLEVPERELAQTASVVKQEMEQAFSLHVPLRADVETGLNWRDLTPV